VGSYLTLQKVGVNFRANCPFHSEKSPSFFVSPTRQMWHCFGGCQTGGDIFKFIMDIEGIEFKEALEILAQRAGVELPKWSPQDAKLVSEKKRLYDIQELTTQFFEKQLESTTGKKVKAYLRERGLSEESITTWKIGYAPEGRRVLSDFLVKNGYTQNEIEKAGLSVRTERGNSDRFWGRIMFPIADLNSRVIGFGGRLFGEGDKVAKYINTSSTPLYDKSKVVYGLDKAKVDIRKKDFCILVEGYTDVILMAQAGHTNIVASSGTALTSSQLRILKRYTSELITAFDMDVAGDKATKRGVELAVQEGFDVKVIVMPHGKDPADMSTKESDKEEMNKLIKEAGSVMDFYLASALKSFDKTTSDGKRKIGNEILPILRKIPSKIEQAHWVKQLAEELDVTEQIIVEELNRVAKPSVLKQTDTKSAPERPQKSRQELLEEQVLVLLFQSPSMLGDITAEYIEYFSDPFVEMIENLRKIPSLELAELKDVVNEEAFEQLKLFSLQPVS
ncbi:MAG TPA: DNA primase, partial [candidate division CPR3 bacterium]|nr:DNA primase [candidate division CPR3 bacterium]